MYRAKPESTFGVTERQHYGSITDNTKTPESRACRALTWSENGKVTPGLPRD